MAVFDLRSGQTSALPYQVGDIVEFPAGRAVVRAVTPLVAGVTQIVLEWEDRPQSLPFSLPSFDVATVVGHDRSRAS